MTCPDVGTLRAWIDEEAGVEANDVSGHLVACDVCLAAVDGLRAGAAFADTSLRVLRPAAEPSAAAITLARQRVELLRGRPRSNQLTKKETPPMTIAHRFARWRTIAAGLAAALGLTLALGTSEGRTVAAGFLAQFRSRTIQPIAVDSALGQSPLAQLDRLGTIQGDRGIRAEPAASVAEASTKVGFTVQQPDPATIPAGLDRTPKVRVLPAHDVRFTFDEAKARKYLADLGRANVDLPAKFNGATLVVSFPSAVALEYVPPGAGSSASGSEDAGPRGRGQAAMSGPMLVVGQSKEITAGVEGGVSFDELRDFLLALPGLPPETARQLRQIQDWRTTLPLPVPVDRMNWQQTTIAGGPGLVLSETTGLGTAAIWQRDGQIHGVAGTFKTSEIQRVADGLR